MTAHPLLASFLGGWELLIILADLMFWLLVIAAIGGIIYFLRRRGQMPPANPLDVPMPPTSTVTTEATRGNCPHCGKPVPPTALGGICPECMLKAGLATQTEGAGATGPHGTKVVHPPPTPAEIASLFPQLEILECLGRGGMGVVYRARQPRLNRLVALKILARDKERDVQFTERFTREAQALARLNHPNIVTVHDFGEAGGHCYLVMEFVDGLNLRQLLQTGQMKPEQALTIVPKICEALQYAHEQGIVHRDIKPENILLDKSGRVKIADFGIAKMMGDEAGQQTLTGAKETVGTPHYMAPEQIEKPLTVDHRADIYSLGVVFYEMLTGELPLGKFAPPSEKVRIDVRLDEVVLHALEKEPSRRYQQVSQVKTAVETIAATPRSSGHESAPSESQSRLASAAARSPLRRGALTGLMVFLAIVVLAIGVTLLLPRTYVGEARVQLADDNAEHIQTECAEIRSSVCLRKVASDLKLAGRWNKKYGVPANNEDQIEELLRSRIDVQSVRNTSLAGIWVYDESAGEAADIANTLAEAYCALHGGQVVVRAILPLKPVRPNVTLNIFIGVVAGVVLGIFTGAAVGLFTFWRGHVARRAASPPPIQKPDHFWRWFAVVVLALMTIPFVIALLGMLAAIAIPNFVRARQHSRQLAVQQWTQQGWQLWQEQKLDDATAKFRRAVELDPDNADAWNGLGWATFNAGKSREAEKAFQKAISIETNQPGALNGLGQIYLSQRKYDQAETYLLKAAPQASAAWYGLTRLYLLEGKFDQADKWAQELVDSGEADDLVRQMLQAAQAKNLSKGLRSRIEPPLPAQPVIDLPNPACSTSAFGPVMEAVLKSPQQRVAELLDLDTGQFAASTNFGENDRDTHAWIRDHRLDVLGVVEKGQIALLCMDMAVVPAPSNRWVSVNLQDVVTNWGLGQQEPNKITAISPVTDHTDTWMFRTREGGQGALQIIGPSDDPRGVKIRYKLVQNGGAVTEANTQTSVGQQSIAVETQAVSGAQKWLALIDSGNYAESWNEASAVFQGGVTAAAWENSMNTFRKPLGDLISRKLKSALATTELPGAPDGQYVVIQFDSSFTGKKSAIETVTFKLADDRTWKSAGYFIK